MPFLRALVSSWPACSTRTRRRALSGVGGLLLVALLAACTPAPPTPPAPTVAPTATAPTAPSPPTTPAPTAALTPRVFLPALPQVQALPPTATPAPTVDPRALKPLPTAVSLGPGCDGLVTARDGQFWRDGQPWTFVGTNFSYLSKLPLDRIDERLALLASQGVTVVRTWILPDHDLDHLAQALALGGRHGIRFVVTFEDFWHIPRGSALYGDPFRESYNTHLRRVVERLKDRPEVFMWQLMNEPTCGPEGMSAECRARMVRWATEAAALVRAQDTCRPLAVGLLGIWVPDAVQEAHFRDMADIPGVDTMTLHRSADNDFNELLRRHMGIVLDKDFPLVWGEIYVRAYDAGCQPLPNDDVRRRARTIRRDLNRSFDAGVDGYLLWQYAFGRLRLGDRVEYFCGEYDYGQEDPVWKVFQEYELPTPR